MNFLQEYKMQLLRGIFFCFIMLAGLLCFCNLGVEPIADWDEARHGISAYEMLKNHNWLINTYEYQPDYWNLKPVLSFWTIIVSYTVWGFNAFALRFPAALSYFILILLIAWFLNKEYSRLAGLISLPLLCSDFEILFSHGARRGDADGVYLLLFTVAMLGLYYTCKDVRGYYVSSLAMSLAFLTKSFHAGAIFVIILLYFILQKDWRRCNWRNYLFAMFCFCLPVLCWAGARATFDGTLFFEKMFVTDLIERSSNAIEGHKEAPYHYFLVLWHTKLFAVVFVCFVGFFTWRKRLGESLKPYYLYLLWGFVPLFLFSVPATKISWYIYPPKVGILVLAAIVCSQLFTSMRPKSKFILPAIGVILAVVVVSNIRTNVFWAIQKSVPDQIQICLQKMSQVENRDIYLQRTSSDTSWQQREVLAAELYHDLWCHAGGIVEYNKHKKSLLLINDSLVHKAIPGRVIYERGMYKIYQHS